MYHLETCLKFNCQCNFLENFCFRWILSTGCTIKRMEEGIRISTEEVLFRRDMRVNILKTQVFPAFSELYFIMVSLFSWPFQGFLYSNFIFDNPHLKFLFNFVTSKLDSSLPLFLSVPIFFSSFILIIFFFTSLSFTLLFYFQPYCFSLES